MAEKALIESTGTIHTMRNYSLDFLKFIFTLFVILSHTSCFMNENTATWFFPYACGWVSVHVFFIISGLLMVNSFSKQSMRSDNPGLDSFNFVIKKFKAIAIEYWIALFLGLCAYVLLKKTNIFHTIVLALPEILGITNCGVVYQEINAPTWYISAMLICMLPLYYLLCKNKDFFIYIFASVVALLTYGFMFNQDQPFVDRQTFFGFIIGALIRALCGICFGVISYIITNRITLRCNTKKYRVFLTIVEVLLYVIFFTIWFSARDHYTMFSGMLVLPIVVAITFSGKSYCAELFKFKFLKHLSSISLALYLNHWTARLIVKTLSNGWNYKKSLVILLGITALLCLVYFILIIIVKKILKKIGEKYGTKI